MKPRGAYLSSCLTYCTWRDTLSVPSCWDKGQVVDSEEPSCCSHGGGSGGRFPRRRQRAPPSPWSPRDGPLTGGRRLAAVTRGSLRVGGGRLPGPAAPSVSLAARVPAPCPPRTPPAAAVRGCPRASGAPSLQRGGPGPRRGLGRADAPGCCGPFVSFSPLPEETYQQKISPRAASELTASSCRSRSQAFPCGLEPTLPASGVRGRDPARPRCLRAPAGAAAPPPEAQPRAARAPPGATTAGAGSLLRPRLRPGPALLPFAVHFHVRRRHPSSSPRGFLGVFAVLRGSV